MKPRGKSNRAEANGAGHRDTPAGIAADRARRVAIEYCLFHYPTLYTAGVPRPCRAPHQGDWLVAIVLSSPKHGVMGEVGELRIEGRTGQVVAATDRARVVAVGERLYEGKMDAPATSAHQARKR
jgi:hypothetical protein